ncbi:MAG: hypothetical protein ACTHMJ_17405 [Thermomicrobiales bacterium]
MTTMATDEFLTAVTSAQDRGLPVFEKIFSAAQPGAVFSPPVSANGYTVITACEVVMGGGFGSGLGFGPTPPPGETTPQTDSAKAQPSLGGGGGTGGGGGAQGRPVAVIVIGQDGVTIKPVFDVSKIALAGITAWGAIGLLAGKMVRDARTAAAPSLPKPRKLTLAKRIQAMRQH